MTFDGIASQVLVITTMWFWYRRTTHGWRGRAERRRPQAERTVPPSEPQAVEFKADVAGIAADVAGRSEESVFIDGARLVQPFVGNDGFPIDVERLSRGLALLEHVVGLNPTHWHALGLLGLGYRRMGALTRSYEYLARAHAAAPDRL